MNCAAISESLLESELFGHEEGAFTGAVRSRRGCFELAHGGVIFLDEIAEMPNHLQIKLLRVLQEREITRVGGGQSFRVDVRVMAATNREPREEVKAGRLREAGLRTAAASSRSSFRSQTGRPCWRCSTAPIWKCSIRRAGMQHEWSESRTLH